MVKDIITIEYNNKTVIIDYEVDNVEFKSDGLSFNFMLKCGQNEFRDTFSVKFIKNMVDWRTASHLNSNKLAESIYILDPELIATDFVERFWSKIDAELFGLTMYFISEMVDDELPDNEY